jgi:hypothetical protein
MYGRTEHSVGKEPRKKRSEMSRTVDLIRLHGENAPIRCQNRRNNPHEIHSDDECHERAFSKEFKNSGVFVATEGLAFPDQAKIVHEGSDGMPIPVAVFPEAKEFLMGYWIVDVESPE